MAERKNQYSTPKRNGNKIKAKRLINSNKSLTW